MSKIFDDRMENLIIIMKSYVVGNKTNKRKSIQKTQFTTIPMVDYKRNKAKSTQDTQFIAIPMVLFDSLLMAPIGPIGRFFVIHG